MRHRVLALARQQRHHGGDVAARAVAAHGDAVRVRAQLLRVLERPAQRRLAVLDRRRERVLGRQPVVDRQHVRAPVAAQQPAGGVVGVEVADHEAAAVVVDDQRVRAAGLRRHVVAGLDRAFGAVHLEVAHLLHRDLAARRTPRPGAARRRAPRAAAASRSAGCPGAPSSRAAAGCRARAFGRRACIGGLPDSLTCARGGSAAMTLPTPHLHALARGELGPRPVRGRTSVAGGGHRGLEAYAISLGVFARP